MPENISKDRNGHLDAPLQRFECILSSQLELHGRLAVCIERKKECIRQAQIDSVAEICEEENEIVQKLGELEKTRLTLIGELTESLRPEASVPLTLIEIVGMAEDEQAGRLISLRDELRERVKQVRRESSVVRIAADKLNRHMIGILQSVRSALSGAGVYEQKGQVALGAQLEFSVDVRS